MLDVSRVGLRVLVVDVLWVSGFACFGVLRLSVVWGLGCGLVCLFMVARGFLFWVWCGGWCGVGC